MTRLELITNCSYWYLWQRPWSSRIYYFENNKQNLSIYLELVILKISRISAFYLSKNKQKIDYFVDITSSRWQIVNNRLLFSVTGIDDQSQNLQKNFCMGTFRGRTTVMCRLPIENSILPFYDWPPFLSARYCCIWDEKYIFVCMLKWKMITAPSWGVWNAELVTSTPEELCLYRQLLLDFLLSWKLSGYFIEFVEFKQRKKNSLEFLTVNVYYMGQQLE